MLMKVLFNIKLILDESLIILSDMTPKLLQNKNLLCTLRHFFFNQPARQVKQFYSHQNVLNRALITNKVCIYFILCIHFCQFTKYYDLLLFNKWPDPESSGMLQSH